MLCSPRAEARGGGKGQRCLCVGPSPAANLLCSCPTCGRCSWRTTLCTRMASAGIGEKASRHERGSSVRQTGSTLEARGGCLDMESIGRDPQWAMPAYNVSSATESQPWPIISRPSWRPTHTVCTPKLAETSPRATPRLRVCWLKGFVSLDLRIPSRNLGSVQGAALRR